MTERKRNHGFKINAKRYSATLINKIRENQYNLNKLLAKKEYIALDAIAARNCEKESIEHVLWQCSRHDEERLKMNYELKIRLGKLLFKSNSLLITELKK